MTDEVRFVLQLGLNLAAVLLAVWLAVRYTTRRLQDILDAERQQGEEARRQAQAEVMANLPPIPPELEQMAEIERWLLAARDLQLLLNSTCTLVRIRLRADESTQRDVFAEIDRSLKFLGRQEKKWLDFSLPVTAYARELDPAKGKTHDQTMEDLTSGLNQAYVQATQSLRRAAWLCDPSDAEAFSDNLANAYLTEADQATSNMASVIASALDRLAYVKQQLPNHQAQQIAAAIAPRSNGAQEIDEDVPETYPRGGC